jgi:hypothetical protein
MREERTLCRAVDRTPRGLVGPEGIMAEERHEKDFGPIDSARERTGIYGLGFDPASFAGLMVPFILSGAGIIGALIIYFWL